MKTTFDLPSQLVEDIKALARARGTTARTIVQQALMRELAEDREAPSFALADKSVEGWSSMSEEFRGRSLHDLVLHSYGETS